MNTIGPMDGCNFYWQYETSVGHAEAISFRGLDESRVKSEFDNFVKTIPKDEIVELRPWVQFIDQEWCAMVIFHKRKS